MYKSFAQPHLDYGDVLYDQPNNNGLCQKIGSIQYNAALAITFAIKVTSQMKLHNELGLETQVKMVIQKGVSFIRLKKLAYKNIYSIWYYKATITNTQSTKDVATFYKFFQIFLFPIYRTKIEQSWGANKKIRIFSTTFKNYFRSSLLKIGQPTAKPAYNIINSFSLKLLTILRLGLTQLKEHKFRHNFPDCRSTLWSCSLGIEYCHHFKNISLDIYIYISIYTLNPIRWFAVSWCKHPKFQTMNKRIYFFMEVLSLTPIRRIRF